MKIIAMALLFWGLAGYAAGGNMAGYQERVNKMKPVIGKVRSAKPVSSPAEFASELKSAQIVYTEYIPSDYGKALGLQSKETWTEMQHWYRLASQEVSLMGQRAFVLNKACGVMGKDLSGYKGEAEKTLVAARKTLKFMTEAPWGDSLRAVIIGDEVNKEIAVRNVQIKAVKDWEKLVKCLSVEKPR